MKNFKNLIIGILGIILGFLELQNPEGKGGGGIWNPVNSLIKEIFGIYSMAILFIFIGISFIIYYFYDRFKDKKKAEKTHRLNLKQ